MKKENLIKGVYLLKRLDFINTVINQFGYKSCSISINGIIETRLHAGDELTTHILEVLQAELELIKADIEQDIENL